MTQKKFLYVRKPGKIKSFCNELMLVSERSFRQMVRDPMLLLMHVALLVGLGIVLGLIFFQLQLDLAGIMNRAGFAFCYVIIFKSYIDQFCRDVSTRTTPDDKRTPC